MLCLFALSQASADSIIALDKDRIICENIPLNQIKEYNVEILNQGDSALKIDKIRSSCKCLNGELVPLESIAPGNKKVLKVRVDTTGLYGKKEYFLILQSNDPKTPFKKLPVMVSILPPKEPVLKVFPEEIEFGLIHEGKSRARIIVKNPGGESLTVQLITRFEGITFSESSFSISPGEKKNVEINAEIGKLQGDNSRNHFITVLSNDPNHKELNIPWEIKKGIS